MAITFPQQVTFQNARLQTLSWCLHIICGCIILYRFAFLSTNHKNIELIGSVQLQPAYNETAFQTSLSGVSQTACDSLQLFDYWRDAGGVQRYDNHSCIPICVPGYSGPCVKDTDVVFRQGSNIFVATQIQDKSKLNSTVRNYFVSSAEAASIQLTVDYNWPRMPWFASGLTAHQWEKYSSSKDVYIHMLNKDGQQVKSFAPGSAIVLSVSEIVNLAGVDSLDTIEPSAGVNHMPNASAGRAAGPSRRLIGMQFDIQVECGTVFRNCMLRMIVHPGTWISDSTLCNLFAGDSIHRTCHGLRIRTVFVGARRMVDVNALFINLTSSVVFFQLPRAMVLVTALYLCGHLSTVYRNVVHNHFSITREAGAMAMRLLQHEVAFNSLESETKSGTLSGSISKEDIGYSLHHILERRQCLDETEVKQMTDFALTEVTRSFENSGEHDEEGLYSAFMTATCQGLNNFWSSLKESFGFLKRQTDHGNLCVDVDTFMAACSSSEPISFNNLVKLFDSDRRVSLLEQFFMPIHFRMALAEMRDAARIAQKAQTVRKHSKTMDSLQSEVQADHEVIQNVVLEVSEERREMDMITECVNRLSVRLDEQQRKHDFEMSEERQKRDAMTEQINALTQCLDEQQRKHKFAQLQALHNGLSEERCRTNTMTDQASPRMLRLEEQQHKLEFEQLQARREINRLSEQTSQIVEMLASLQALSLEALEKEKTGSSSTPMPDREHCNQKPDEPLLNASVDSEWYQEAQDVTCKALPKESNTQADFHEMRVQAAGFLLKEICKMRQLAASPTRYDQEHKLEGEAVSLETIEPQSTTPINRPVNVLLADTRTQMRSNGQECSWDPKPRILEISTAESSRKHTNSLADVGIGGQVNVKEEEGPWSTFSI